MDELIQEPSTDSHGPEANDEVTGGFWWLEGGIWGFWMSNNTHDGDGGAWFGRPGRPGRLRGEGGWAGYFLDSMGVHAFGEWWGCIAVGCLGSLGIGLLGILTYSLHTLTGSCRAAGRLLHLCGRLLCCCKRAEGIEAHLPSTRPPTADVEWHGPRTGWPTETRYLQQRLKGRGSRRRLNDVVIRRDGHVARLYQEESMLRRIDSDGLRVKFCRVAGCTSRQFRRDLEEAGEVHLCRQLECRAEHPLHIQEFAGVDHEVLIDLHAYAHGSPRWLLGLLARGVWRGLGCFVRATRCVCRRCCTKRGARTIREPDGHERSLDPDSESEAEGDEATCQGMRIGIIVEGEMRPLAPDGCGDLATQEETTLLDEDIEVSDVRPPGPGQHARVALCTHHRQIYQSAASKRKCGVLTCYRAAKGARHGVPLCYDHLCEQGNGAQERRDSPHPHGMHQGLRRRFTKRPSSRSRSPALEETQAKNTDTGAMEAGNKKGNSSQRSQSVDLGKIMIPSPPRGVLDQEDIIGKKVWLKVRVLQDGGGHDWVPCLGEVWGYTPGGVRGENKLEVFSAYLDNVLILDPKFMDDVGNIMESEEVDVHKAQELVKDIPVDAEGIGLDIKGYLIPVFVVKRLGSWEGRCIPSGQKINGIRHNELRANLNKYVRKHSAGYVKGELWPSWPAEAGLGLDVQVKAEKNVAPPAPKAPARRSRSRSRSHSLSRAMREHDEERQGDAAMQDAQAESENEDTTRNHMLEAYIAAVNSGQTQAEAVETLRMIYEVDDEEMKATLRSYIKKNAGKQSELMEAGINTLRYLTGREKPKAPEPEVLETPNKAHMDIQKVKRPDIHQPEKTPNRGGLFPVPFGGQESGELIRSASQPSNRNPLIISDGVVNQLFGTNTMQDDGATRAGAGEPEDDGYISARVVHALEGIRKATEGDKKGNPGTRSSISSEDSLDVYLARGCNTLTVEVCPDVTGKELFDALKRACAHAKAKLQQIEWPCLVTNGIAYGLASLQHGGKDHTTLAPWQLSVAHAVTAKPRDFDQYEAPKDDKIEPKPRYPTHFATWLKQAKNEVKMIGSVLGLEHKKERLAALDLIEKAHEQDADVWPENYCYSLWEELKAAWVEELRESRRRLCRILNTDNPRKEDLKFVALAPDSGFRFPRTFDLAHPEGYYQQVCVPRQARALKGIIYGQLHHKRQAPKVGGEPMAEDAGGEMVAEDVDKVGKGREKGDPKKKKEKEKEEKRAYPAGKRLRPKEAADSVKHAPRTKEGKPICWDGATHMGCSRGKECAHAHQPITTTKGLIRRGGLRSGPLIHPNQVDGRVAQLRSQAKAEHDEKVKDGVNQKQGWLPPEEYGEVQYTQLEEEIRELTRGPDAEWLLDPALGDPQRTGSIWKARVEHPEAKRRLEVLQELESAGTFDRIKAWSSYLQSHVRSRLLNAHIENVAMTIDEILLEATEKGCPELAVEAEKVLEEGRSVGWVEEGRQAWISAPSWNREKGYGEGKFDFRCGDIHHSWLYLDYKDKLSVGPELASALGMDEGEEEERQCLVLPSSGNPHVGRGLGPYPKAKGRGGEGQGARTPGRALGPSRQCYRRAWRSSTMDWGSRG